jgi:phosphoribosyl 1,2-cyclic phosphate phosphodiesterase
MPVFGTNPVLEQIKGEYAYAFAKEYYPGIPRLTLNEISTENFLINQVSVTPLPVMHLRLPVLGFRLKNFSYITDANNIPDDTMEKLKGTEILVLNALQREPHISHFNLEEAIKMVEKIKPRMAYFTHISHKLGLHTEVGEELPSGIQLAYDGLRLSMI